VAEQSRVALISDEQSAEFDHRCFSGGTTTMAAIRYEAIQRLVFADRLWRKIHR
jgi:hypothetical protein